MNVESLRSNADTQKMSVEVRIAKTAITVCFLFVASWTPYAVVALIGAFGNQALLTPGMILNKLNLKVVNLTLTSKKNRCHHDPSRLL